MVEDVNGTVLEEVLDLWCGKEESMEREVAYVMMMASVADRFQIAEVVSALEDALIGELEAETCGEVLMGSIQLGLKQVEDAAWGLAVERFEEVSGTAGFLGLDEETMGRLLEEDGLGVKKESVVLEGLVRWMKDGGGEGLRGRELLRNVRFGVIEREYLDSGARMLLPEEHRDWMDDLVSDARSAMAAARAGAPVELRELGAKALTRRTGMGVDWQRHSGSDGVAGRILGGQGQRPAFVLAMVEFGGRMCSGYGDGTIRVWNMATLRRRRVINDGANGIVWALAAWEGRLASGHSDGRIRVWDVHTGEMRMDIRGQLDGHPDGHAGDVRKLCACGARLVSGSEDGVIKVWGAAPRGPGWVFERTLAAEDVSVSALAWGGGVLISGSEDSGDLQLWDLDTGGLRATLAGHVDTVAALLVHGRLLLSGSFDGSIRVWAVGTWAVLASVMVADPTADHSLVRHHCPRCLAVSGSKLISGSGRGEELGLRVWDLHTMVCEHALMQPAGVECLAAAGGEVWGAVGKKLVVWGRD